MFPNRRYIVGLLGLLLVAYSFLLNAHVVDLLLVPAGDTYSVMVKPPSATIHHSVIAHYNKHHSIQHPATPVSHKHHSKSKSAKHNCGGFKCILNQFQITYNTTRLSADIHMVTCGSYYYVYFGEINPPPPKFS